MDPIKQAFDKIKQEMSFLKQQIDELNIQIQLLKDFKISQTPQSLPVFAANPVQASQDHMHLDSANPTHNPTQNDPFVSTPTHNPTIPQTLNEPESQNMLFSTGNRGVPTDNPTNRPTDQQTVNLSANHPVSSKIDQFYQLSQVLGSLDSIKKDIRIKFKQLTPQEMSVFSTVYSLQDQEIDEITYKIVAQHLKLSESSIRDYTTKIISKGIPLVKTRQNNKKITLKISPELQKIASLSTINKLREL